MYRSTSTDKKPNLFIVGAAKAGTSSLWGYLDQHPEIYMSQRKEPGFFCDEWPGKKDFHKYLELFRPATDQHKWVGEASTMYLSCPGTASNLSDYAESNGLSPKFIVMLRNPADRAYSLYNWQVQEGYEHARTFDKALRLETSRVNKKYPSFWRTGTYRYNYLYFRTGLYADQIQEYYDELGRENVHVIIFEEFIRETKEHLRDIYRFLELEHDDYFPDLKVFNPSHEVVSPMLQFGLRKVTRNVMERKPVRWMVKNKSQRDFLITMGWRNNKPPKLQPSLRAQLLDNYRENIEKLEGILEKDLSIWYQKKEDRQKA